MDDRFLDLIVRHTLEHSGRTPMDDLESLRNEIDDLKDVVEELSRKVSLLTIQLVTMKQDLFGNQPITRLDCNGNIPSDR